MTALRSMSPPELHMDKPLVVAVSRAEADIFRAWRQQAFEYTLFFVILSAAAAFGLYRGQLRRQAFARLEASAARERRQSAEQLELALQGADLGLWDWDLRGDRFEHNQVTRKQLGYAPGEHRQLRRRVARHHPSGRPGADARRGRGALSRRDRGLRMRVPGAAQERPLGLAAEPRQGGRARRVRHRRAHGRHAHGPDPAQGHRGADGALGRAAQADRRAGADRRLGARPRDLRLDWTEQVYRIHELEPGIMPTLENAIDFYAAGRAADDARRGRGRRARRHARGTWSCPSSPPRATRAGCGHRASP